MKKIFVAMILSVVAAVAFAIPSPKLIEDALAAHNYVSAKQMVHQVLAEKPDSARAHLLNAYLLIHADRNPVAANAELETAKGLDKSGDIKSSALFGRTVAEIQMTKPAVAPVQMVKPVATQPYVNTVATPQPVITKAGVDGFTIFLIVLACSVVIVLIIALTRTPKVVTSVREVEYRDSPRIAGNGFDAPYGGVAPVRPVAPVYQREMYSSPAATVVQPVMQGNPAMGAFGTAAAVAGGVVAGELLHDALTSSHHSRNTRYGTEDYERRYLQQQEEHGSAYTSPVVEPSPVSYETDRSSYSSSSSDSDSWGSSSSYDSGSSSSWDSGSSDSGSSWD